MSIRNRITELEAAAAEPDAAMPAWAAARLARKRDLMSDPEFVERFRDELFAVLRDGGKIGSIEEMGPWLDAQYAKWGNGQS